MKRAISSFASIALIAGLLVAAGPRAARAGDGTYTSSGQCEFKVWMKWNATAAEIDAVRVYFTIAADGFRDALNSSQKWSKIAIHVGAACPVDADFVILNEDGRSPETSWARE